MNQFNNDTIFSSSTTTKRISEKYIKNQPFDSWYIGGLLFMLTVILVLLYANFYRENAFQILWQRFLLKLNIRPSTASTTSSSLSKPAIDELLI